MKKRLLQLLADNRRRPGARFQIAVDQDEPTIYLYDVIVGSEIEAEWFGGVAPLTFIKELASLDAARIHLRINSPGGDVFGARAMQQALREHPAQIVVHVDGWAASAASVVMLAGDDVIISDGGMVMIHKAWTLAIGNSDEMLHTAALLEKIDATLAESYANRGRKDASYFAEAMAAETFYTAAEAVEVGLADRIAETEPIDAQATGIDWDLRALGRATAGRKPPPPAASARDFYERRQHFFETIAA
ncbi:MAG: head maturation protease, ClpP-related [Pseudomonadota bacterium]